MWVTKLLIFPVEIRIFCPKTTKFGPKLAFLVNLGQAMQAYSMPCCGSVGGCGARAVSRKTPIYFIYFQRRGETRDSRVWRRLRRFPLAAAANFWASPDDLRQSCKISKPNTTLCICTLTNATTF